MTQGDADREELGTPQQDALTKGTRIGDARRITETPCVVPESADLREAAEAISVHRRVHIVAVVDTDGRLAGIIPLRLLLDELFLEVAPEEFLTDILDRDRMETYGRMVHARTAGELMQPPVYVAAEDTIGDAFGRMHDHDLEGLPIVDAERRPVGYLDRLELLKVWLREHQSGTSGATG